MTVVMVLVLVLVFVSVFDRCYLYLMSVLLFFVGAGVGDFSGQIGSGQLGGHGEGNFRHAWSRRRQARR